jgi:hypothetical protein
MMTYSLIYNSKIPKILQNKKQKRLELPYRDLQKLEIKLRECIQNKLETASKNWWKERVPKNVQEKTRTKNNSHDTPEKTFHSSFTLTSPIMLK